MKAVVIDAALNVVCDERVTFDADLPEYRTAGGVNVKGRQVTAPTIMWVKALDMLMEKIRIAGKTVDSFDHDMVSAEIWTHKSCRKGLSNFSRNTDRTERLYFGRK